jgi:glutamine synthetase
MNEKDLLKRVKEEDVKFISLQFTDVVGGVKSVDMPVNGLEGALADGAWFDGSSVEGFAQHLCNFAVESRRAEACPGLL